MNKNPKKIVNGHLETLIPHFMRSVKDLDYKRVRINTKDQDFLDLDFLQKNSKKLAILSHGLESSSRAKYIQAMGKYLHQNGFDILAWNCRGCSGEVNKSLKYYHSGVSWDLDEVIKHVVKNYDYQEIYLVGFSMGANITLKYLGEYSNSLPVNIVKACVFSAPCNLADSSRRLDRGISKVYTNNFMQTLKQKVKAKERLLKEKNFDLNGIYKAKNFSVLDELLTAPLNGFKNAEDYYEQSSSIQYIPSIKTDTLIVNALNDPFLAGECYPKSICDDHQYVDLETPKSGGHCGFMDDSINGTYWSEKRCLNFFTHQ